MPMLTKKRSDNLEPNNPKGRQSLGLDVSNTSSLSSSAESSLTPSPSTPTGVEQTIMTAVPEPEPTPRQSTIIKSPPGILTSSIRSRSLSLPPSQRSSTSSVDLATTAATTPASSPIDSMESSTTSLSLAVKVKFAPLPELAPRKRKSTTPLGIAARGQMMRRRRGQLASNEHEVQGGTPMWTAEEVESHRRRQHGISEPADEELEDPFVAFGKFVKDAWRKMSTHKDGQQKDTKPNAADANVDSPSEKEKSAESEPVVSQREALATIVPPNDSPATENNHQEGRVYEEPGEIGHTDTIRSTDGSAYPWSQDADLQPIAL